MANEFEKVMVGNAVKCYSIYSLIDSKVNEPVRKNYKMRCGLPFPIDMTFEDVSSYIVNNQEDKFYTSNINDDDIVICKFNKTVLPLRYHNRNFEPVFDFWMEIKNEVEKEEGRNVDSMNNKKDYAEFKKEQVEKLKNNIIEGIKNIKTSEQYKDWLTFASSFHHYSLNNQILIYLQNPNAHMIKGYEAWKKDGRYVRKGEKGLSIIAPVIKKQEIERYKKNKDTGEFEFDENGNKITETVFAQQIVGFTVTKVFDISQTEGKEIPKISKPLKGTVDFYKDIFPVAAAISKIPIDLQDLGDPAGNAFGYTKFNMDLDTKKRNDAERIVLNSNEKISDKHRIKTLFHEMAHATLHANQDDKEKSIMEIEAESVAYIISNHFGIDTSEYSFGYLTGWLGNQDVEVIEEVFNDIAKVAHKLIVEFEDSFKEHNKERKSLLEKEEDKGQVEEKER